MGNLEAWLNCFEQAPEWEMVFAEKVVFIGDERVLVVVCVTPKGQSE